MDWYYWVHLFTNSIQKYFSSASMKSSSPMFWFSFHLKCQYFDALTHYAPYQNFKLLIFHKNNFTFDTIDTYRYMIQHSLSMHYMNLKLVFIYFSFQLKKFFWKTSCSYTQPPGLKICALSWSFWWWWKVWNRRCFSW